MCLSGVPRDPSQLATLELHQLNTPPAAIDTRPPGIPPTLPLPSHHMTTRLRDGIRQPKVRTDVTIRYPLSQAHASILSQPFEPTCFMGSSLKMREVSMRRPIVSGFNDLRRNPIVSAFRDFPVGCGMLAQRYRNINPIIRQDDDDRHANQDFTPPTPPKILEELPLRTDSSVIDHLSCRGRGRFKRFMGSSLIMREVAMRRPIVSGFNDLRHTPIVSAFRDFPVGCGMLAQRYRNINPIIRQDDDNRHASQDFAPPTPPEILEELPLRTDSSVIDHLSCRGRGRFKRTQRFLAHTPFHRRMALFLKLKRRN
ncbi:hypothetical protein EZV62_005465 [Acer yangbiense]|uniref:Uncharacterized protein n=1 Tax=Acer yangbiense TaxID=1000413 RepID=A0A5C7IMU1_9ROSI|nr:hypothetical protein EZV62_005465 [Acer yangbiense]